MTRPKSWKKRKGENLGAYNPGKKLKYDGNEPLNGPLNSLEPEDTLDSGLVQEESKYTAPARENVLTALKLLQDRLKPPRATGQGYKDAKIDLYTREHLLAVLIMFRFYCDLDLKLNWSDASTYAAKAFGKGSYHARSLREWGRILIDDPSAPFDNPFGHSQHSALDDEDFRQELYLFLQACGRRVKSDDVIEYTSQPEVQAQLKRDKPVCKSAACNWMHELGFIWGQPRKGQYKDGHERDDVTDYRQTRYLPELECLDQRSRVYDGDGNEIPSQVCPDPSQPHVTTCRPVTKWTHDESTFIQNDQPSHIWNSPEPTHDPQPKGEGQSLMVSDFVSATHGFLHSRDGAKSARVLFEAGKNRDGYFCNKHILAQMKTALEIIATDYPDEDHAFIFDNATIHVKRSEGMFTLGALSATGMPKNSPKKNFLVERTHPDGTKYLDRMQGAKLPNGEPQDLYWPPGHPSGHPTEWWFKGMAQILFEQGWQNAFNMRASCSGGCPKDETDCCCRKALYTQPDFCAPKSALAELVESHGHKLLLSPKYHCELNAIEQCWGEAKRNYRQYGAPKSMAEMRHNVVKSLDGISITQIRRYFNRADRFADGYRKGMTGSQAAWATKLFHRHRAFPDHIMKDVKEAGIS